MQVNYKNLLIAEGSTFHIAQAFAWVVLTLSICACKGESRDVTLSDKRDDSIFAKLFGSNGDAPGGCVSWWAAEGNTADRAGKNGGTMVGGLSYAPGKVGLSFRFNGSNSCVIVPNSSDLVPRGSFSIEGWIYPEKDTSSALVCKWGWYAEWENQRSYSIDLVQGGDIGFGIANDSLQWDLDFQIFRTTGGPVKMLAWNHVAVVYDQPVGARRIFIDGVLKKERFDPPIRITSGIADVSIGAYRFAPGWTEAYYKGRIDELSFYNRALTGEEVAAIYDAGSSGKRK